MPIGLKQNILSFITARSQLFLYLAAIVTVSGLAHGFNMLKYPSFFDDEGTYLSQAMSVLYHGELAPYTYWYDHAPLGWILVAAWGAISGGFFTFGWAVYSARIFMMIVQVVSSVLLFLSVRKLTKNNVLGLIAVVPFALSPLSITMHRMLFLDNLVVPFLLASLLLTIDAKKLSRYFVSGLLFGLAVLVKESAIFLLPPYLLWIWLTSDKHQKNFAFWGWLALAVSVISLYPLYALLNNELFPSGSWLGGQAEHVSLIETAQWQLGRSGGFFLSEGSQFRGALTSSWWPIDSLYLGLGFLSTIALAVIGVINKTYRQFLAISLIPGFYIYYLIRGGIVNDQFIIPILPMFSISLAILSNWLHNSLSVFKTQWMKRFSAGALTAMFIVVYAGNTAPYTKDVTSGQIAAIEWVKQNTDTSKDLIVIDAYALPDLMNLSNDNLYEPYGAHHYWKVDLDPALSEDLLNSDWREIDYVIATSKVEFDVGLGRLPITKQALQAGQLGSLFTNDVVGPTPEVIVANMGNTKIYFRSQD